MTSSSGSCASATRPIGKPDFQVARRSAIWQDAPIQRDNLAYLFKRYLRVSSQEVTIAGGKHDAKSYAKRRAEHDQRFRSPPQTLKFRHGARQNIRS